MVVVSIEESLVVTFRVNLQPADMDLSSLLGERGGGIASGPTGRISI